ncbi:MAG: thioredoxin family protein [Romboutsia sp.]
MKKSIVLVLIAILSICLVTIFLMNSNKLLRSINSNEYVQLIGKEKEKLVYIGRPSCLDCAEIQPILENKLNEENVKAYYYNTEKAKRRSMDDFNKIKEDMNIEHVPIIIRYNGDKEIERYEYTQFKESADSLDRFIEKYKLETNS